MPQRRRRRQRRFLPQRGRMSAQLTSEGGRCQLRLSPLLIVIRYSPSSPSSVPLSNARRCGEQSALRCPKIPSGLRFSLQFYRCGNCGLALSATGSARPQFPRRGKHSGLSGMPAPTYRPGCIPGNSTRGSQAPFGRFNEGGSREGKGTSPPPVADEGLVPFPQRSKNRSGLR